MLESINPSTGARLERFQEHTKRDIETLLEMAQLAFLGWRNVDVRERGALMKKVARVLRGNKANYAAIITREMGKPITEAEAEVEKCALGCEYYAVNTPKMVREEVIKTSASRSYVRFDPLGAILAVMPWNFPFWQVFRAAVPSLMAGNAVLVKHASNVSRCSLTIEAIFKEAGFPDGLFQSILIGSGEVGRVIRDPRIKAVTLTGSEEAGRSVAREAGAAIKKCVLELGGSDPFIVLKDADIPTACRQAAFSRLMNSGQSCISAKRFIVVESVFRKFIDGFVSEMKARQVGNPLDRETQVGPLARADILETLEKQVRKSLSLGATVLCGGKRLKRKGNFYLPTVLSGVQKGMPVFDEETFGPVAAVIKAKDEEEAISLANETCFGLGASLWTKDLCRAERLAARLEAGCVFVNDIVKSDPRVPFGGTKCSGFGRELSHYGIKEFVNIKTVWVK